MASKFGKGYYGDWQSMMRGIQEGCEDAFEEACYLICDEINERIREGIYVGDHPTYERTMDIYNMPHYVTPNITGLQCEFAYDNEAFMSLHPQNPEHHALSQDSGNGYNAEGFVEEILSPIHDGFMLDIKYDIQKKFPTVYRECCKKRGFVLS